MGGVSIISGTLAGASGAFPTSEQNKRTIGMDISCPDYQDTDQTHFFQLFPVRIITIPS
jgi:hypothetical protein